MRLTSQTVNSYRDRDVAGQHSRGFTLIELLLATSLGSMVLAVVYLTFNTALDSQRRINRVSQQVQEHRFVFERIRTDIKNIVESPDSFMGASDTLSFKTVSANGEPQQVHYGLRTTQNGAQLVRTVSADGEPKPESDTETVVFSDIQQLAFRYRVDDEWMSASNASALPVAIECTVQSASRELSFTINVELDVV